MSATTPSRHSVLVRVWLLVIALLVALTAIVGAATRLTGSGLSITEWAPVVGVVPPLDEAQWQATFAKYKEIPQYTRVNKGMTLAEFRSIFWWEWGHRILGRAIGLAFLLPFLALLAMRAVPRLLMSRLLLLFALGGIQGGVGWYMVRSGLADRVDVSPYRLVLHLGLAVVIFGLTVWTILRLGSEQHRRHSATLTRGDLRLAHALLALLYAQILIGALVAGLKAGSTYNTWPLMDGGIWPSGLLTMSPWWVNAFENPATVQFSHRLAAYLLIGFAIVHAARVGARSKDDRVRHSALALVGLLMGQAALGIWTLLSWVPIGLGIAHQAGAFATFAVAIWHVFTVRRASAA